MGHQIAPEPVLLILRRLGCVMKEETSIGFLRILPKGGHCSLGWSYGFKVPIITEDKIGAVDLMVTKCNINDRKPLRRKHFIAKLYGKPFGDKGYIPKELFTGLFSNGVHLIIKLGKNI